TFLASGIAVWGTVNGLGPFGAGTLHESLILLQVFMGVVAVTALLLGAAVTERSLLQEQLQQRRRNWSRPIAARMNSWPCSPTNCATRWPPFATPWRSSKWVGSMRPWPARR